MTTRLDPKVLSMMGRLDLAARFVVEGFFSGRHRSPYRGHSVEFSQHRQYVHGDDTRHIDWKAYGKTERYYLKEYERETNLQATILIDTSNSMSYRRRHAGKIDYAKLAAAALAYLALDQQDAAAVMSFAESVTPVVAPTGRMAAFYDMCEAMLALPAGGKGDVAGALHSLAGMLARRGVVVVISDFLADVDAVLKGFEHLRFEGHDCLALQVLDEDEIEFELTGLCRFEGLEGEGSLVSDAGRIRRRYRAALEAFLDKLRSGCVRIQTDYVLASTGASLDRVLSAYLLSRARRGG